MTLLVDNVVLSDRDFRRISDLIYSHCGINLHEGKKELVRARLAKRLRQGGFRSFPEYMRHVMDDKTGTEFSLLVDSISTNLTAFFREPKHFDFMRSVFLPSLLNNKRARKEFRIRGWNAGCSSGEEAWSVAITLLEATQGQGRWDIKVLATDISTSILERARSGVYEQARIQPVPSGLKSKYLTRRAGGAEKLYEVAGCLKDTVMFRYLNLMKDWPIKGPVDFIFCRNVMIYFDKATQQNLVSRFWDVLAPGGVLFTGHSESLTGIAHKFKYVQPTIYMKP